MAADKTHNSTGSVGVVTITDVGAATACEQFKTRVAEGEWYRDDRSVWRQRTAATPVVMPAYCG